MNQDQQLYEQALALATHQDWEGARETLCRCLELNPGHVDAHEVLGVVHERLGDLDAAVAVTKRMTEIAPHSIMGHANLSRYYMLKGMIPEAEEEQAKARTLGWKEELREAKRGGAITEAGALAVEGPTSDVDLRGVSSAFETPDPVAQYQDAMRRVETYRKLVELDPGDPMSHYTLGTAYEDARRLTEAESHLREAVRLDSEYSAAFLALGRVQRDAGKLDAARETFTRGIDVADANGDLQPRAWMNKFLGQLDPK